MSNNNGQGQSLNDVCAIFCALAAFGLASAGAWFVYQLKHGVLHHNFGDVYVVAGAFGVSSVLYLLGTLYFGHQAHLVPRFWQWLSRSEHRPKAAPRSMVRRSNIFDPAA